MSAPTSTTAVVDERVRPFDHPPASPRTRLLRPVQLVVVRRARAWTALHLLSLGLAAVVLLVANRNQWFWGDEWAFVADRGPGFAQLDLFRPHNDHWSTIPLLTYWALLSTVGLTSYTPYVAVVVVLHLTLAHLLWRACLRTGVRPALATGLVGVFAVLGAGAENLLWAFQVGFVGAMTFGWAAVLLHDHDGGFDRRDVAGWAASIAALLCAGPALVMVGVATLTVWLRRRSARDTALAAAVPGLVFALWWSLEGRHADHLPASGDLWGVMTWAGTGLAHAVGASVGVPWSGGLLVVALLIWWGRHLDLASGRTALAFAGAAGAVAFYLMIATGRVSLGFAAATTSRYLYIGIALLLPAVAVALTRLVPSGSAWTVVVLGLCGALALYNVAELRHQAGVTWGQERALRGTVVAAARSLRDPDHVAWNALDAYHNPNLTLHDVRRIDGYGWLPATATTATDRLTAEAITDVAFVPVDDGHLDAVPPGAPSPDAASSATVTLEEVDGVDLRTLARRPGCVEARSSTASGQVALAGTDAPWRVRMQGRDHEMLRVQVVSAGDEASRPLTFELTSPAHDLVSGTAGRTLLLTLPRRGPVTFCGVTAPSAP